MQYIIVYAQTPDELAVIVNKNLDDGFKLYGQLIVQQNGVLNQKFLQVMTKPNITDLPNTLASTLKKKVLKDIFLKSKQKVQESEETNNG